MKRRDDDEAMRTYFRVFLLCVAAAIALFAAVVSIMS